MKKSPSLLTMIRFSANAPLHSCRSSVWPWPRSSAGAAVEEPFVAEGFPAVSDGGARARDGGIGIERALYAGRAICADDVAAVRIGGIPLGEGLAKETFLKTNRPRLRVAGGIQLDAFLVTVVR
jgi:hypothetical protein